MLKYTHEFENWHSHSTVPLFQFSFLFILPQPRKECLIAVRDKFGRILQAQTPKLPVSKEPDFPF